jgi:hypothetical protein
MRRHNTDGCGCDAICGNCDHHDGLFGHITKHTFGTVSHEEGTRGGGSSSVNRNNRQPTKRDRQTDKATA